MKTISPQQLQLLLDIWSVMYDDTTPCDSCTHADDKAYVKERVRREGIQFLTVTLPTLGKAVERGFETSFACPPGFKRRGGTVLPQFMFRALSKLFDPETGLWLGEANATPLPYWCLYYSELSNVVGWVRQLTLMFYKMKLPYEPSQTDAVKTAFIKTEAEIQSLCWSYKWAKRIKELILMRAVIGELFKSYREEDENPCHGSGASANGRSSWQRYKPEVFVERLHEVFPYQEWAMLSDKVMSPTSSLYEMGASCEPQAKVCYVPKDSRGPRLISEEPEVFMYIQQGLMRAMYRMMERHPYARMSLSCLDQERNRYAAALGSDVYDYATLDMKDASDRVSCELVRQLFPPDMVRKLMACRSLSTVFPDGTEVPLGKFAPMGSACCFPVEAIVFWAAALVAVHGSAAVHIVRQRPGANRGMFDCTGRPEITVYGDDIVVPGQSVDCLVSLLEDLGLKTNLQKSFRKGPFRESCGYDAFLSRDVSIVRCNHLPVISSSKRSRSAKFDEVGRAKIRLSEFMNNVIRRHGTWMMPRFREIFSQYYGYIPVLKRDTLQGCYLLGNHDDVMMRRVNAVPLDPKSGVMRLRPHYDRPKIRLLVERPVKLKVNVDDWSHILRSLLGKGGLEGSSSVNPRKLTRVSLEWVWY